jgi:hypothetical protein
MSLSLTNVQQVEFDELVKIAYRSQGFILRDSVRIRMDVIGNTVQFRSVDQIIAQPAAFQSMVNIQDPNYQPHVATLQKYMASSAVDVIQDLTVNFDSKRENAMVTGMALGRRSDQIIIDALAANPSQTIVDGGTNMSYAKLRQIVQFFDQNAVPVGERFVAMSGNNIRALLADDHITSRFFTSNDMVVDGQASYKELLGMNIRIIPDMTEGGLPKVGNIRHCFAWHKMSTGMGIGQDMRVEINYLPQYTSWLVNGIFYAGATIIDSRGVFQINCDESVNP